MTDFRHHPLLTRHDKSEGPAPRSRRVVIAAIVAALLLAAVGAQLAWFFIDSGRTHRQQATAPLAQQQEGPLRTISFEELFDQTLRNQGAGNRQSAHRMYQELLRRLAADGDYSRRTAAVLPRAANFYRDGSEIPAGQVEYLYQQALAAIFEIHGDNYYDLENVYAGLEHFYRLHHRYTEAVEQTRLLLDFYARHYPDENTRFALVAPTRVRLGQNLMQAGRNAEARAAFEAAIALMHSRGQSTAAVEAMLEATRQPGNTGTSLTGQKASRNDPAPTRIATSNTGTTSAPVENLKERLEALRLDGVTVEQLIEDDRRVTIVGFAADNVRVAAYMRLLSDEIGKPELQFVQQGERRETTVSEFSITMKQ